jgi:trk system potassium uptake protein TrkA
MKAVFLGTSDLTKSAAELLLKRGHDVVIIEQDKTRIDELSDELAAGFIHGDGSKPAILREPGPSTSDFLFCLTSDDRTNILASLLGRSLNYPRVITRIADPAYEHLCIELGLQDIIVPDFTIARYLVDMCEGLDPLEVTGLIKNDARIFTFIATENDEVPVTELELPEDSRLMFFYREEKFVIADEKTSLKKGDEIVIIAHSKALPELEERWGPKQDIETSTDAQP